MMEGNIDVIDEVVSPINNEGNRHDNSKIFPQKLMEIINDSSNSACISWHPDGKIFIIHNRQKFESEILTKYSFCQKRKKIKYASFTRKLNRWNFTRVTDRFPQKAVGYFHKYFQRDNQALCTQMYCNNDRTKYANTTKLSSSFYTSGAFPHAIRNDEEAANTQPRDPRQEDSIRTPRQALMQNKIPIQAPMRILNQDLIQTRSLLQTAMSRNPSDFSASQYSLPFSRRLPPNGASAELIRTSLLPPQNQILSNQDGRNESLLPVQNYMYNDQDRIDASLSDSLIDTRNHILCDHDRIRALTNEVETLRNQLAIASQNVEKKKQPQEFQNEIVIPCRSVSNDDSSPS